MKQANHGLLFVLFVLSLYFYGDKEDDGQVEEGREGIDEGGRMMIDFFRLLVLILFY